jgi:CheY-like chemotaxis protein
MAVLVVEDDPAVLALIETTLRRAGHDVIAVPTPGRALAALEDRHPFDVVLTDVVMPEMSGFDLADEVRRRSPRTQIVFTSGYACDLVRRPISDPFLAKPFTIAALTTVVRQAWRSGWRS